MSYSIDLPDLGGDFLQLPEEASNEFQAKIKVVGVGGSGCNAVNTMISFGLQGVEFIVFNTDAQSLNVSAAPVRIPIGQTITRGLGAGADPEKGRKAALEDVPKIKEVLAGADMVFITAGMGGGTGTGAAPVIAQIAREEGALCVAVVTKPFGFEGRRRAVQAELGLAALSEQVDTIITIPNDNLLSMNAEELTFHEAFRKADEVLYQAVSGITEIIRNPGTVNVDFADIKTTMLNKGRAIMGTGCAKGEGRTRLAAEMAVSSPLLDNISLNGATSVLLYFVGSTNLKLGEMQDAAKFVQEQVHEQANIIWGASSDDSLEDMVKVTVVATGFDCPTDDEAIAQQNERAVVVPVSQQIVPTRMTTQNPPARSTLVSEDPAFQRRRSVPSTRTQVTVTSTARSAGSSFPAISEMDWDIPAYTRRSSK